MAAQSIPLVTRVRVAPSFLHFDENRSEQLRAPHEVSTMGTRHCHFCCLFCFQYHSSAFRCLGLGRGKESFITGIIELFM